MLCFVVWKYTKGSYRAKLRIVDGFYNLNLQLKPNYKNDKIEAV